MPDPISVVVVDPHCLFRDALVSALNLEGDIQVSGVADSAAAAVATIAGCRADVVVYAQDTPGMDLLDALQQIRHGSPASRIIVLVENLDEHLALKGIENGACGFVRKDQKLGALAKAIGCVHRGEYWIERRLAAKIIGHAVSVNGNDPGAAADFPQGLTPREREVLRLLARGYTNRKIGEALFISEKTVKTHLSNIYAKLNITKRVEAILYITKKFEGFPGAPVE